MQCSKSVIYVVPYIGEKPRARSINRTKFMQGEAVHIGSHRVQPAGTFIKLAESIFSTRGDQWTIF